MKQKKVIKLLSIAICLIMAVCCYGMLLNNNTKIVKADDTTISNDINGIPDFYLYTALLEAYNSGKTPNEMKTTLTVDMFNGYTTLNLKEKGIKNLIGINLLNFSNLQNLDLSENSIDNLLNYLFNMNLSSLNLSSNALTSFDCTSFSAGTNATLLQLNLSNNKISLANLKNLTYANVDLTKNNLTNQNNITFPTSSNATVNISHNHLNGIQQSQFNCTIIKGLQGIYQNGIYDIEDSFEFYGLDDSTQINVLQNNVFQFSIEENEQFSFAVGAYTLHFVTESDNDLLSDINLIIKPTSPVVEFYQNNQKIDITHTLDKETLIKFLGEDNASFSYTITVNSSQFSGTGNEVLISNQGVVMLQVKQIINGIESQPYVIMLNVSYVNNWSWVFVLFGVLVFAGIFYGARMFMIKGTKETVKKDKNNE